jgi:hypothetical protein
MKMTRRKKEKKVWAEVDWRVSKGRKIRFTVHHKQRNFCFPMRRPEPVIDTDNWFKGM